jgi:hypothetical protein
MKIISSLALLASVVLCSCTAIEVKPLAASPKVSHLYIRENPKVIVTNFVPVMQDGFARHGISSQLIAPEASAPGKYVVTYTALRSWDFAPYLSVAEIQVQKDGLPVAYAKYHLRGKVGYSMYKWQGTKTKMDPVIDQLLQNYPIKN